VVATRATQVCPFSRRRGLSPLLLRRHSPLVTANRPNHGNRPTRVHRRRDTKLDSQIEELRPYGSGGYRLDAIDAAGKVIAGVTAYVEVPAEEEVEADKPESPSEVVVALRELTSLLRESMQTNSRALEAMASAFGPIRPARLASSEPIAIAAPASEQKATDWASKVMEALPVVAQILPTLAQVFNSAVAQGMANGNSTGGNSTPPVQA
jgi:hypothetical protein